MSRRLQFDEPQGLVEIAGEATGSVVGAIAKRIRAGLPPAL
jgi:hypothetical protein